MTRRIDWHCECGDGESVHLSYPDGERCGGHCQRTERDCNGRGYRPIAHSDRSPAFSAMLEHSNRLSLPEHFTCDLSTDYQSLQSYSGRFVWVLRTNGTEFYRVDDADRNYSIGAYNYWTRDRPECHVFFWDGLTLAEIPVREGLRILQGVPYYMAAGG